MNIKADTPHHTIPIPASLLTPNMHLGPAEVVQDLGDRLAIQFPDQKTQAVKAITPHYTACPGDQVLVIGQSDTFYAIGVIRGRGKSHLCVDGDLNLQARGGKLSLQSDVQVQLHSPKVSLRTLSFDMIAEKATETFTHLYQTVTKKLHLKAGSSQTQVVNESTLSAGSITQQAKEDVRIDGDRINLG